MKRINHFLTLKNRKQFDKRYNRRLYTLSVEKNMKKLIIAVGLIVVILGLAFIVGSNASNLQVDHEFIEVFNEWSASIYLEKDQMLQVHVTASMIWSDPNKYTVWEHGEEGIALLYATINITDPEGGSTLFVVNYRLNTQTSTLWLYNITLYKEASSFNATAAFDQEAQMYMVVGGAAIYSGEHKVKVFGIYPPREEPPAKIQLWKGTVKTVYPYTFLHPTGIVVVGAGVTTSLFGIIKREQKRKHKRRA